MKIASPFLNFLLKLVHRIEFSKFKDAVSRNPNDHYLRARFAKFCLNHYFNHKNTSQLHVIEAVNQFENIDHSEVLDLEVFYLMGKYYQGQDDQKAAEIYLKGIKRYNEFTAKNYALRHDYVEMAFSIALNLLNLEHNHADPELEKFFKIVRKTYLREFMKEKVNKNQEILEGPNGNIRPIAN